MVVIFLFTVPSTFLTWVLWGNCPHMWVPVVTFLLCVLFTLCIEAQKQPKSDTEEDN